ncbi:hypothetical protein Pmar_PMAR024714 [Perkinsus marinus ATCC 50983]|uniref:Uncharacterized protein n=1 Tax=Perkinsus marinus (strain ATCC 50983 / TXsc) TaxID=423536 RepID=C5M142_PERM5|nr:hypothetical protein Pmar_PMAR024714 [Perkinsus marinus ATCC 50983]EEQ97272.1 hypothetical protein Pmar_PMAR024714 [Perkinsus marinus ATCC 50983]|eukprot:XP_002764555.1 hypothetical protein Pmar_PMAR024714 [Perkinsus marinus ATCC 50983]
MASSAGQGSWERCKSGARELERSIEGGIAELSKMSGSGEKRGSTGMALDDQVEIVTTLMGSTERQLRQLQEVVDEMGEAAKEKSRYALVQRHRGILTSSDDEKEVVVAFE